MEPLPAKPNLLRQVNLSRLLEVLTRRENATRAELAEETGISATTVRALLVTLLEQGEVQVVGRDASSGGRQADRYALCPDRHFAAAFCCQVDEIQALLVNLRGAVVETVTLHAPGEQYECAILPCLDDWIARYPVHTIALGIPGIVEGGCYWQKCPGDEELTQIPLGSRLSGRYRLPVLLENDMNAVAIGFGRCYAAMFPEEVPAHTNMAYVHFEAGCVSAGLLVDGRIIRGHHSFAGELGLVPAEGDRLLDSLMAAPMDDRLYTRRVSNLLGWLCGIVNPQYIALGGPALRTRCISAMGDQLFSLLPRNLCPELLYAADLWQDYREGMAHLAAQHLFTSVLPAGQ